MPVTWGLFSNRFVVEKPCYLFLLLPGPVDDLLDPYTAHQLAHLGFGKFQTIVMLQ